MPISARVGGLRIAVGLIDRNRSNALRARRFRHRLQELAHLALGKGGGFYRFPVGTCRIRAPVLACQPLRDLTPSAP